MAPDSRFWRHQLGEAPTSFRRSLLKAIIAFCLVPTMLVAKVESKMEPSRDTWSSLSFPFLAYERVNLENSLLMPSLTPPSLFYNASPAGRWSSRIQIHIPNQPTVQRFIRYYTGEGRITFADALHRSCTYVPMMAEVLESYGVPAELVCVVLVESRFKTRAMFKGAGGYWQLLAPTARSLGLRVDRWVDERLDPVKSTQAAAKYLRSFYEQFNSWPLALAAYNAGNGPIVDALDSCEAGDFWELSQRGALPGRTRTYVSKVMAAIRIMRDPEAYGFTRPRHFPDYDFEPITVQSLLKLEQIAQWIGVPVSYMQELNPSLRQDRVPPGGAMVLRLPSGARDRFDVAYEDYLRMGK